MENNDSNNFILSQEEVEQIKRERLIKQDKDELRKSSIGAKYLDERLRLKGDPKFKVNDLVKCTVNYHDDCYNRVCKVIDIGNTARIFTDYSYIVMNEKGVRSEWNNSAEIQLITDKNIEFNTILPLFKPDDMLIFKESVYNNLYNSNRDWYHMFKNIKNRENLLFRVKSSNIDPEGIWYTVIDPIFKNKELYIYEKDLELFKE